MSLVVIADSRTIAVIARNINLIMNMKINNTIYYCLQGISPTIRLKAFRWEAVLKGRVVCSS
jgi:hypothetical protein